MAFRTNMTAEEFRKEAIKQKRSELNQYRNLSRHYAEKANEADRQLRAMEGRTAGEVPHAD